MKQASFCKSIILFSLACVGFNKADGQGLHFSQYYNAPMLLNPANSALMSESDFRIGINYRNQWSGIVPYNTISAYGDCQLMRNRNYSNWMGLGFALFNDKAGDGILSLTTVQGNIAYHVMTGDFSMISAGMSVSTNQRSINYNKLTFNDQWVGQNGVTFDNLNLSNNEQDGTVKTNFYDVGAGVNYATFPNEFTYIKIGVGANHLNQPKETFYGNDSGVTTTNKMGIRPTANVDVLARINEAVTLNPSLYYTQQKKAFDFTIGSLGMIYVGGDTKNQQATQLILGAFYRWDDAVVAVVGFQWGTIKLMSSYDYTVSSFTNDNNGNGAFEFSISYQGMYGSLSRGRETINCPRF